MSEFLEMRSFEHRRMPLVEKVIRDGTNMYNSARFVIVLNDEGEIIEKINGKFGFVGNFLVVLAPVTYKGVYIPMSVVLEIGIGRATPYQQFEQKHNDGRITIKSRIPIAKLKNDFVIKILPLLAETIQLIVDSDISHRKRLIYTQKKKGYTLIRSNGSFIKIKHEEEILFYVCHLRDIETRRKDHLNRFANHIIKNLTILFGKSNYYTDSELKKQKIKNLFPASNIAYSVNEVQYPTHIMEIVRDKIIKRDKNKKGYIELFDQILRVYKIKILDTKTYDQELYVKLNKKFGGIKERLLNKFPILIEVDIKRTLKRKNMRLQQNKNPLLEQSKGCVVIQVKPSRELLLARGEIKDYETHT